MTEQGKPRKLTARHERFVAEYLIDLNATQAAIRAGYATNGADVTGYRLLVSARIAAAIAEAKAKRAAETGITAARVLDELALLAFSDHTNYVVDDTGTVRLAEKAPKGAHRAVSSIRHRIRTDSEGAVTREVEIRLWDKPGMLKLAGRHVGLFPDRVELTAKDGAPLPSSVATVTFVMPDNGRRVVPMADPDVETEHSGG